MLPPLELPPLPVIGFPETFYATQIHRADKYGNIHLREAMKVAQYVTLGNDPHLRWDQKRRYFEHAIRRHCTPPPLAPEAVWLFYMQLRDMVKQHAGAEALRLACQKDDAFAERARLAESRAVINIEARGFFRELMGDGKKPDYFSEEDWGQLNLLRMQWT
ncbi:MAG TPA: hypothetical protein VFC78_09130 [Tepidisphaeraceae bacterium]|nr:hypothetical protein [Tepidisphaeraceae bacterium]